MLIAAVMNPNGGISFTGQLLCTSMLFENDMFSYTYYTWKTLHLKRIFLYNSALWPFHELVSCNIFS
ncbi:hypothetical protein D3H55_09525 [Bacillus salacetis]|uniref:Uncharacterized protein n=1 Tax=Bacillus salacetis TaxID=2315464 RepID=A0A3A1R034_9BACI|nr:hypothetical protein D3H55_09525 [Bacillus salacetis]